MVKNLFVFCLLIPLVNFNASKKIVVENQILKNYRTFELNLTKEIKKGSVVHFELINNSISPISVFGSSLKNIRKFKDEKWMKVRILSYPYGANFIVSLKTLTRNPSEKYQFDWNLVKVWCDKVQIDGLPKTNENISEEGLNSVTYDFSMGRTSRKTVT